MKKKKLFRRIAIIFMVVLVGTGLFIGVSAGRNYNKGPAHRVAAKINGQGGQPTEEYIVKAYVYREQAEAVFHLINQQRLRNDITPLEWDESTYVASQQRAIEASVHFSHERPDGSPVQTISSRYNGENLGSGSHKADDANGLMKAWMQSSGHRENVLNPNYQSVSVACVTIDDTSYWVQLFSMQSAGTPVTLDSQSLSPNTRAMLALPKEDPLRAAVQQESTPEPSETVQEAEKPAEPAPVEEKKETPPQEVQAPEERSRLFIIG